MVTKADDLDEQDGETFTVTLSAPTNATLGTATGTGTINDDTDPPVISIGNADTVTEGGTASFEVTMAQSAKTVTVQYATGDGTAQEPGDYTSTTGTLTFTAGQTTKTIDVVTKADDLDEQDGETFTVTLSAPTNATLGTATGTGTINDDTDPPVISIENADTVTEGGTASFEVTMAQSAKTVTVQYATGDGTAQEPGDYTSTSGTLTFTAGQTTKTIDVVTKADDLDEQDGETFTVTLSAPTNATLGTATGTGTINDDTDPPVISIENADTVTEGGTASFEVTMAQSAKTVTVQYATGDGTAQEPGDYTSTTGTLTFTAGQTTKTIEVVTKADDLDEQDGETFTVTLSAPTNATLGTATGTGTINDDTDPPVISIGNADAVTEGGTASFEVTMAQSAKTVTVQYATGDGTAQEPGDYTSTTGTLTFTAGQTTKTIDVVTKADDLDEQDGETFTVTLSAPTNATLGTATGTGTINDDTGAPVLSIGNADAVTEGGTASFEVTLAPASGKQVTVSYETAEGTAKASEDYTAASSTTLTFTAGDTTKTVSVATTEDTRNEATEAFTMTLSGETNATLPEDAKTATGTITDDDPLTAAVTAKAQNVPEGQSAEFEVKITGGTSTADVVVLYSVGGTATSADYDDPGDTLTIASGAASGTITITTKEDEVVEPSETLEVTLTSASTASRTVTVGGTAATTTILDGGSVTVSVKAVTVEDDPLTQEVNEYRDKSIAEEGESAEFAVEMSGAVSTAVQVSYATENGTAESGTGKDYTAASGTLTYNPGASLRQILTVDTSDDTLNESTETFSVKLTASTLPPGVALGATTATGSITDLDALEASVTANAASVGRGRNCDVHGDPHGWHEHGGRDGSLFGGRLGDLGR